MILSTLTDYKPLTAGEKFKLATQDSFDRGTVALASNSCTQIRLGGESHPHASRGHGPSGGRIERNCGAALPLHLNRE
jgi:hypothetical protein